MKIEVMETKDGSVLFVVSQDHVCVQFVVPPREARQVGQAMVDAAQRLDSGIILARKVPG